MSAPIDRTSPDVAGMMIAPHQDHTPRFTADATVYLVVDPDAGLDFWHVVVKVTHPGDRAGQTYVRDYLALDRDKAPEGFSASAAMSDLVALVTADLS